MRAVFTDIDGIFFELVDHFGEFGVSARLSDEIKLIVGLETPLDLLVERGFLIIGVTNQPDVSRGNISREFLATKHGLLLQAYPQVTKIFTCEHTESDSCDCRKPKPGLLTQAATEFRLDLPECWMVGDAGSDVEAGLSVQARTVFVETKYNADDSGRALAKFVASGPLEAFQLIADIERVRIPLRPETTPLTGQ